MFSFFRYFVYGSWWVSICASALGLLTWYELTTSWWNATLFFFILGSTLVVYNLNMLSGLEELRKVGTHSERHHWCMKNERLMQFTLILGLVLTIISIWYLHVHVWFFMVPLSLVALVYTLPIIRNRSNSLRLREIGMWKIFIIAAVWAGMTAILPAVHLKGWQQLIDAQSWQLALERSLFILAITVPFDIRDLANDAKKGVRTIPSVIGTFRSVMFAELLLLIVACLILLRLGPTDPTFLGYLMSLLITMFAVSFASEKRSDMYCSFWVEGTMMIQFLLVYIMV